MSVEFDDEILQDFLVEAGELLDELGKQLVELEKTPEDFDLLNAIFRSFHTIKGGAGFLSIGPLVAVCHKAEDVFNTLRQGERKVQADLMDTVLRVVDVVNEMFDRIRDGGIPDEADQSLLNALASFVGPGGLNDEVVLQPELQVNSDKAAEFEAPESEACAVTSAKPVEATSPEEITEAEFDDLIEALHGKPKNSLPEKNAADLNGTAVETGQNDLIGEQEFEDLLDQIHGVGKRGAPKTLPANGEKGLKANTEHRTEPLDQHKDGLSDQINESEFEDLLDHLYGKGKHGGVPVSSPGKKASPKPVEIKPVHSASASASVQKEPRIENRAAETTTVKPAIAANKTTKGAQPPAETTVRVDVQTLDDIMNLVGELVLVRNRFENLRTSFDREQIAKTISNLDVVTSDLQREVMKTRMQPIKKVFGRFPRVVRDLARGLKKEIRLELRGEDTDLDKNLVEALADPLVHLVRNAVDHGIELPEDRAALGKSREGKVVLTASQEGDHIQLMIEDDGKGMNPDRLRRIVVEKGLMDEESAARLDRRECFNLIFMPGFSTKSEISDISGRGVGMDVVKTRINQMSGSVEVDSVEGKGSKIIIKVPLTLAIMPTLMVKLNDRPFAIPLTSVVEILDLDLRRTNLVEGQLVVVVRGHALPLFYLRDWLVNKRRTGSEKSNGHVVVVNVGGRKVGFVVDHLIGQEEVVIKALGAKLQGVKGLSGATITGDGNIALIIDVPSLMTRYAA
ncbi:MAG: chemotaxis protein CheA [Methylococcales bacterium]